MMTSVSGRNLGDPSLLPSYLAALGTDTDGALYYAGFLGRRCLGEGEGPAAQGTPAQLRTFSGGNFPTDIPLKSVDRHEEHFRAARSNPGNGR